MIEQKLNPDALRYLGHIETAVSKAGYNCNCATTPDNVSIDKDWLDYHLRELRKALLAVAQPEVNRMEAFINERPGYITALKNTRGTDDQSDYWRWQGHAESRRQLAQSLGWTVPHNPGETTCPEVKP